jgi:acetyl esterase/lipase
LAAACGAFEAPEPAPTPNPVEKVTSISYAEEEALQRLDVYTPAQIDGPYPTVLAIHGGGFAAQSKSMYAELGPYFAKQGFAFVAIDYRLAPEHTYPAQVSDSFCALAWLHANDDEYGFDTSRVVVLGGSAGGYLAAMVGAVQQPDRYLEDCPHDYPKQEAVHAAVIFYGFFDFVNVEDLPQSMINGLARFWGAQYDELPLSRLEEMSPVSQIDGAEPPFLLLHGTADTAVPSVESEQFAAALEQAGVDVELVLLPGVGHAFELESLTSDALAQSLEEIETFLDPMLAP